MLATNRLLEIEQLCQPHLQRLVLLELEAETLRLVVYLNDGSNLRITEQWQGEELERYSYYWLTSTNTLKIGWDNAPHHTRLENFPHHKHVGRMEDRQPSFETRLEEVIKVIFTELSPSH